MENPTHLFALRQLLLLLVLLYHKQRRHPLLQRYLAVVKRNGAIHRGMGNALLEGSGLSSSVCDKAREQMYHFDILHCPQPSGIRYLTKLRRKGRNYEAFHEAVFRQAALIGDGGMGSPLLSFGAVAYRCQVGKRWKSLQWGLKRCYGDRESEPRRG